MSDDWTWIYNPDAEQVIGGLPVDVIAEVERLADQLTTLGADAVDVGRGRAGGNMRTVDLFGGRGFFMFFAVEHIRLIAIVRVTWVD